MFFWRITEPNYKSDYHCSFINGLLEHPFSLPGVKCDMCGETWGGMRVLPFNCPDQLRHHKNITNVWPIDRLHHASLQKEVMAALSMCSHPYVGLRPGDQFQPCFLDVPSRPVADFLWASVSSLVVSERIKDVLIKYCSNDIIVCPVVLRKIGKKNSKIRPPMPTTGEPEDIINKVSINKDISQIGPYFEIIVKKKSKYSPGGEPIRICSGCKRKEIDKSTRKLYMTHEMWKGDKIFFLSTTTHIIIVDELKERILEIRPTNVIFEKI